MSEGRIELPGARHAPDIMPRSPEKESFIRNNIIYPDASLNELIENSGKEISGTKHALLAGSWTAISLIGISGILLGVHLVPLDFAILLGALSLIGGLSVAGSVFLHKSKEKEEEWPKTKEFDPEQEIQRIRDIKDLQSFSEEIEKYSDVELDKIFIYLNTGDYEEHGLNLDQIEIMDNAYDDIYNIIEIETTEAYRSPAYKELKAAKNEVKKLAKYKNTFMHHALQIASISQLALIWKADRELYKKESENNFNDNQFIYLLNEMKNGCRGRITEFEIYLSPEEFQILQKELETGQRV